MVMKRIPFDRDAVTITPPAARRLLERAGFEVVRTDSLFIFPKPLAWLRPRKLGSRNGPWARNTWFWRV